MRHPRPSWAGMKFWYLPLVLAMLTGVEKLVPPSVDFAVHRFWLTVSGQKAKTSPFALVLISLPTAVPLVSNPLIRKGADHVPPDPFLVDTKHGLLLCQIKYMLSVWGDVALWSIHSACLSMFDWVLVTVESNVQVAP